MLKFATFNNQNCYLYVIGQLLLLAFLAGRTNHMVQAKGVEPLILSAEAYKTPMYDNSNTPG